MSDLDCGDIIDNAVEISDNTGPFQSKILKISNVEEVSHTVDRLTCKGTASLGNGGQRDGKFSSYQDSDGRFFVEYSGT